jgi:hypothetical protein
MLWRRGGGNLERASCVVWRIMGGRAGARSIVFSTTVGFDMDMSTALSATFSAGRSVRGGVLPLRPSNFAASDAVLRGRTVPFVELDMFRVYSGRSERSPGGERSSREGESSSREGDSASREGEGTSLEGERRWDGEAGGSGALAVPRVFSHDGAFCEALLVAGWRRDAGDKGPAGSLGLRGEPVGVEGRAVDGEPSLMEPGRRKGDWRALLKKRGDGLDGVGVDWAC